MTDSLTLPAAPAPDRSALAADPHTLTAQEAALLLRGAPWRRFVVIGDSIAEGLGEEAPGYGPERWSDRVAEALRASDPGLCHRNLGRRYLRTAEVHATQLAPALEFGPDLASVVCGGNDVLDPDADITGLEEQLDALVAPLRAAGADVITFTLLDITRALELPGRLGAHVAARLGTLAELWRSVARRHGTIHVEMYGHPACADPGIYSSDRMHANTRGHAIVAAETVRALRARIA